MQLELSKKDIKIIAELIQDRIEYSEGDEYIPEEHQLYIKKLDDILDKLNKVIK